MPLVMKPTGCMTARRRRPASIESVRGAVGGGSTVSSNIVSKVPIVLTATLTCPLCGHVEVETMPVTYCQYFYDCKGCRAVLRPARGGCCVYCSFSDQLCPPRQGGKPE